MLNKEYKALIKEHPTFKGKINIVGHSLGGLVSYDILANQDISLPNPNPAEFPQERTHTALKYPKLDFEIDYLFAIGSPIAACLVQRGQSFPEYFPKGKTRFFNLFNIHDPIAYRIEPLIDPRYLEISPILLQRPSAGKQYEFSYYKQMMYAYLPDLSLSNIKFSYPRLDLPMPDISIPDITIPDFGSSIPGFGIQFPQFPFSTNPSFRIPPLPDIPVLSNAQEAFKAQFSSMLSSMWGTGQQDLNAESGSKRQRNDDEIESHLAKRRKQDPSDDSNPNQIKGEPSDNPTPRRNRRRGSNSDRPIRQPHSKKQSKTIKREQSFSNSRDRVFDYIAQFFNLNQGEAKKSKSEPSSSSMASNVNDLGERLTKELVQAADEAQKNIQKDHADRERFDYFVEEKTIDNVIHQYMIGMNAHFSYW